MIFQKMLKKCLKVLNSNYNNNTIFLSILFLISFLFLTDITTVYADETIIVDVVNPCFSTDNITSAYQFMVDCGFDDDFLTFSFMGYEWMTGGRFTLIIASIIVLFPYIKYHKPEYSLVVGISMLPISYQFIPDEFFSFAMVMVFLLLSTYGYHMLVKKT